MNRGTWVAVAICGFLGGCADLVPPPSSPIARTALKPDPQAAEPDVQTATDLSPREPANTHPAREAVRQSKPATQETASTSSTLDEAAIAAKRAQDERLAQRERAVKRAISGICTGC